MLERHMKLFINLRCGDDVAWSAFGNASQVSFRWTLW